MTDTLNRLIDADILARVELARPKVSYGVWIPGKGWLTNESHARYFSDYRIELAQSAARLYGQGAFVTPFDESLKELEIVFLTQERKRIEQRLTHRFSEWMKSWTR